LVVSDKRYEYDGLNVLRIDERCDADGDGAVEPNETTWRTVEVNTHRPGSLSVLVGKRVYTYSSCTSGTPSGQNDYTYAYDPLGNAVMVFNANASDQGNEAYYFTQDAFGNDLDINTLGGSDWSIAAANGITEHQTGKWLDEFTGHYFFHARWYDSEVGRFTGRDRFSDALTRRVGGLNWANGDSCGGRVINNSQVLVNIPETFHPMLYALNNPVSVWDPDGEAVSWFWLTLAIDEAIDTITSITLESIKCSLCFTLAQNTVPHPRRYRQYLMLGLDFNPRYARAMCDELEASLKACPSAGASVKAAIDQLHKALKDYDRIDVEAPGP